MYNYRLLAGGEIYINLRLMQKHLLIITYVLFLKSGFVYSQCDTFSQDILKIIKTESYSDFNNYLHPPEEMIKILHWEASDSAYALLNELNDSLFNALVKNVKDIRDSIISKNLDINSIRYLDCYSTYGIISEKKIRFTVGGLIDSFNVFTIETSNMYISQELEYHNEWDFPPFGNYEVVSDDINNSIKSYNPHQDEIDLGFKLLENYLKINSIDYNTYQYVLGYKKEFNRTVIRYIVFRNDNKIKLLEVDLENATWTEIVSE